MERKPILFAAAVFVSILLWIFFLNASGISLKEALLLGKYKATLATVLSTSFLLATLLFPLPFALTAIATKKIEKQKALRFCLPAAAAATIAAFAIFPVVSESALVFIFYIISFLPIIESADLGFKELKRFITPRATSNAVSKANLILSIGLFIASALIIMPSPDYVKSFEESILSSVSSDGGKNLDISDLSTTLIIQTQKESYLAITSNPLFEKLRTKTDPDVNNFVSAVDSRIAEIDSEEYKQAILQTVKANQGNILQGQGFTTPFELVKKQVPMFQTLEQYLWAMEALL